MPPPKNLFNQAPKGIIQSNRIWILGVSGIFIVVLLYLTFKSQSNHKGEIVEHKPQPTVNISTKDNVPDWLAQYKDKKFNISQASKPKTSQEIEKETINSQQIALKKEVIEDQYQTQLEIQKLKDKNKIDDEKLEIEAMKSPLAITVPSPPAAAANHPGTTATAGGSDQLDQVQQAVKSMNTPVASLSDRDKNGQDEKKNFLKMGNQESDYLNNKKIKPLSPYEVKAGTYIPAALVNGINSDLPGSVIAQVTENVYDTVTGNYILIPQGTKLVGAYDSKITFGQNRALVVWNRLIFPDGSSIDLEKMQGVDIGGYAGLKDKLNNHYFKIYSNALLLSLVGAGYDILNNNANSNITGQFNAQQAVAAQVGQKLSDVSSQSLQRNMDVQPTITIEPGIKFNVIVMKDMVLEEIKDAEGTLAYSN